MDLRAEYQMMLEDVRGCPSAEAVATAGRLIFNVRT
jgi:hypothetical protein